MGLTDRPGVGFSLEAGCQYLKHMTMNDELQIIGNKDLLPFYSNKKLLNACECKGIPTLLKRLQELHIPYRRQGNKIYVLYEHIRKAFEPTQEPLGHYHSESNDILKDLESETTDTAG